MDIICIWIGLLGAIAVLTAVCALCVWLERKLPVKRFDERQQGARNKAYRFGFWAGIVYYFVLWVFLVSEDIGSKDAAAWVLTGILMQVMAGETYMVLTGSALPFSQKPAGVCVLGLAGLLNCIAQLLRAIETVEAQQKFFGQYTVPWMELVISAVFLDIAILYLIELIRIKRAEKEDE